VQEGEEVAFTGYPIGLVLGLHPSTHAGIISAISPIVLPSPTARTIKKEMVELLRPQPTRATAAVPCSESQTARSSASSTWSL
jgi:hypothetical protein